jgi:hypothetical protein
MDIADCSISATSVSCKYTIFRRKSRRHRKSSRLEQRTCARARHASAYHKRRSVIPIMDVPGRGPNLISTWRFSQCLDSSRNVILNCGVWAATANSAQRAAFFLDHLALVGLLDSSARAQPGLPTPNRMKLVMFTLTPIFPCRRVKQPSPRSSRHDVVESDAT